MKAIAWTRESLYGPLLTVCICDPAVTGGYCGSCLRCGNPITSLMADTPRAHMVAKYPDILDQTVLTRTEWAWLRAEEEGVPA